MSILDHKKYKQYLNLAQQISKLPLTCQQLAYVDGKLTQKWVDSNEMVSHRISIEVDCPAFVQDVENSLDCEYGKSLRWVTYSPVRYLHTESFSQIGLFARNDININTEIPGVIGYLVSIPEDDILEGYNDFSIVQSSRVGVQWLMLGPISFINASCKPNVAYVNVKNIMVCVPLRQIKEGEELTISYQNHFFGPNNQFCLCPYKSMHGNPFPEVPSKKGKVDKNDNKNAFLQKSEETTVRSSKSLSRQSFPTRFRMFFPEEQNSDVLDYVSYGSFFSSVPASPRRAMFSDEPPLITDNSFNVESTVAPEIFDLSQPIVSTSSPIVEHNNSFRASSPVNLVNFEESDSQNPTHIEPPLFDNLDFGLYEGCKVSQDEFNKRFDRIDDKHHLSDIAKKDILKLIASILPQPNQVFAKIPISDLPLVTITSVGTSKMIFVDLIAQINRISCRNANFIHESWSNDCSWEMQTDLFCHGELQLVLNTDGAPVFKSNKLSVWPLWVQLYNLPPLLRASYANICLLGLWHGESKPDLNYVLRSVSSELENFVKRNVKQSFRSSSFSISKYSLRCPRQGLCFVHEAAYGI